MKTFCAHCSRSYPQVLRVRHRYGITSSSETRGQAKSTSFEGGIAIVGGDGVESSSGKEYDVGSENSSGGGASQPSGRWSAQRLTQRAAQTFNVRGGQFTVLFSPPLANANSVSEGAAGGKREGEFLRVRLRFASALFGAEYPCNWGPVRLADPRQACSSLNETVLRDSWVLVDRGGCNFADKALQVQAAGGAGLLLVNDSPEIADLVRMPAGDVDLYTLRMPAAMITKVIMVEILDSFRCIYDRLYLVGVQPGTVLRFCTAVLSVVYSMLPLPLSSVCHCSEGW